MGEWVGALLAERHVQQKVCVLKVTEWDFLKDNNFS